MRLIMIAGVAVLALTATAAFGQEPSPPANTVGNGTAKAVEPGPGHMVGKPVSPSTAGQSGVSQRRKATAMRPRPGSVPANGSEKPAGTTGAPPYGSSTPNPDSSSGADETPHGG
jgi:hypothetical protein